MTLDKAVNWLDGRKTLIGVLCAVVYVGAVTHGVIVRNSSAEYVIEGILGVGLGHKVVKA